MNIVVSNVTELQIQREILNMFSSIQQSTSSKLSLVQIETAEYYILIWDTITCSLHHIKSIYCWNVKKEKSKVIFLASLNDVQILLNNIVFVVSPGNGFIGSLNMKLWGNLRLPLTHFKIKSEPSASKGLSNSSVFICKNYRSEQKDDSYFHR